MIPKELKYTKDHEWVKISDREVTVGITDHAQSELGDITFVDLPEAGKVIKSGENAATIESVKAASEVYAPVSGEITAVNSGLNDTPEMINRSPYGDGWICRIAVQSAKEAEALMDSSSYENYLKEN